MTLSEAAEVLGLHPGTLRLQIANGKLRARKVGPVWVVTSAEVERYRRESLGKPGRRERKKRKDDSP